MLKLVEFKARTILRNNPKLHEFIMGMGGWIFTDKAGDTVETHTERRNDDYTYRYVCKDWAKPVAELIDEWDQYLKLTGNPMRFTLNGPVITDW